MADEDIQQEAPSAVADHLDQPAPWESAVRDLQLNFSTQMQQLQQTMMDVVGRFNPVANSQQAEPSIADVSDEELENVVATGQGGKKLRQMVQSEMAKLKKAYIDPLEAVGLNSIANLTQEVTRRDMPHYERFKKEINGMLREVPANQRLNPETHKLVYQAVVGLHVDELANEAAEAAIRKSKAPAQDSGSAAAGRGGGMSAKDESPEAVFGVDAVRSLHEVGRSADETYKRMGYKGGYKEYLEKNKDYL